MTYAMITGTSSLSSDQGLFKKELANQCGFITNETPFIS